LRDFIMKLKSQGKAAAAAQGEAAPGRTGARRTLLVGRCNHLRIVIQRTEDVLGAFVVRLFLQLVDLLEQLRDGTRTASAFKQARGAVLFQCCASSGLKVPGKLRAR
jgi:hypothetical protein